MKNNIKIDVVAVVVTYNRKELLMECLEAILHQSYKVDKIILIDNASNDGTYGTLVDRGYLDCQIINYVKMSTNTGGAGGFYEGIIQTKDLNCDWIWLMDDDTVPQNDCLEKLLRANKKIIADKNSFGKNEGREIAYLSSCIYGSHGEYMNVPQVNLRQADNGYAYWYRFLNEGIVSVSSATFVSILIKKAAIIKCGLPCKDYFIWGDDTEYTRRLSTYYGEGYLVGESIAIHKRALAKDLVIDNETNPIRIDMFHYLYRNRAIIRHYYDNSYHLFFEFCKSILNGLIHLKRKNGCRMARAIIRGQVESIFQYRHFKEYMDGQIQINT